MRKALVAGLAAALLSAPAHAVLIGGVDFPQGSLSFADAVVSYDPVLAGVGPSAPHSVPSNALGAPDYVGDNNCTGDPSCAFVSLGDGGRLVLRFLDNRLTGSGTAAQDLWIFEVGPDVEDTFVHISMDGITWHSVGEIGGSTSGIDIDAFGWGPSDEFAYVQLTDDGSADGQTGDTVGADIDAVGAISTVAAIPEPETYALLLAGLGLLGFAARRKA